MTTPRFKILDVRLPLSKGEEPFDLIRREVDKLTPGRGLTLIAPFVPAPLIELLKAEGVESTLERRGDGAWSVNFWRT